MQRVSRGTVVALLSVLQWTRSFVALLVIHCTTISSMHMRILVLQVNLLVRWFGLVSGGCAGVRRVVSSGVVDNEDDDVIHSASDSIIQGFSEYHDDSCARLNALLNSRVERGHDGRGETKLNEYSVQNQISC